MKNRILSFFIERISYYYSNIRICINSRVFKSSNANKNCIDFCNSNTSIWIYYFCININFGFNINNSIQEFWHKEYLNILKLIYL